MKVSTLGGVVIGFGAVIAAFLLDGGHVEALLNVPAALVVFGGTLGATLISFPLARVLQLPRFLTRTIADHHADPHTLVTAIVGLSERARRQGLLSLEEEAQRITDPFFRKGLLLVVDGIDPEVIRSTLEAEMIATSERHEHNYQVLEAMGGIAPTMGIIGTVMGLIHVLGNLDDPSNLGHAIAAAFVATLYGVASANLLWLPLAAKLKAASREEMHYQEMILMGLLSVQSGDNPRITREKLVAFLPSSARAQKQDGAPGPTEGKPPVEAAIANG